MATTATGTSSTARIRGRRRDTHRARGRHVHAGVRQQPVGQVEDLPGNPVADLELGARRTAVGRAERPLRRRPSSRCAAGAVACARSPSTVIERERAQRRASIRQLHRREVLRLVDDDVAVAPRAPAEHGLGLVEQRHVGRRPRLLGDPCRHARRSSAAARRRRGCRRRAARRNGALVSRRRTSAGGRDGRPDPSIARRSSALGPQLGRGGRRRSGGLRPGGRAARR